MRGRNLSTAFRTLYRQVGQSVKRPPSCAQTWRVENECDKSTPRTCQARTYNHTTHLKKPFHQTHNQLPHKQHKHVSVFSGQVQATSQIKVNEGKLSQIKARTGESQKYR